MLLDWTLRSTVLLVLVALTTVVLRRAPAATRHLVWGLGLAGALLVPPLSLVAPRWQLPAAIPMIRAPELSFEVDAPSQSTRSTAVLPPVSPPSPAVSDRPWPSLTGSTATANDAAPQRIRIHLDWSAWLLPLWLAGASLVLGVVAIGLARVRVLRLRARPLTWGPVARLVAELLGHLDVGRSVTVLRTDEPCMPMTWGSVRPVVLLPADADRWPADRLRAVLLHELAHVKRHDYATQLIARLACAVYWFNPLVWIAARRLRVERELACDDLVLAAGSRASDYAAHLLEVARSLRVSPVTAVATIAMARPSQLANRLLAVLDAGRARGVVTSGLAVPATLGALLVMFPLAGARSGSVVEPAEPSAPAAATALAEASIIVTPPPAVSAVSAVPAAALPMAPAVMSIQGCDWQRERNTSASHNVNDDETRIRIRVDECELIVNMIGDVGFTADDADVASVSSDGSFEIKERQGRSSRRLVVERGDGGVLERRWWVDDERREYDAAARAWLAQMLPVLFRRTGLNAKARATRILQQGGVDALLQEISLIPSDWGARQYFAVVLARTDLSQDALRRIVRQAGQEISSDFELTELLVSVAKHQPLEESVRVAYVEAAGSIGSDFESRRALSAVLDRDDLSQDLSDAMIRLAKDIESDFELASLLIRIVDSRAQGNALSPAFFEAVGTISSDFERKRVLTAVARRSGGNQAVLDQVLQSIDDIESNFERAEVLRAVASEYPPNQSLPATYVQAASSMSGSFEQRGVLVSVLERQPSQATVASLLEAAGAISSNVERAEFLVAVARKTTLDDVTRPPFFRAMVGFNSDFERSRVLKQVIARTPVPEPTALAVLQAAGEIDSDFELAGVLIALARNYKVDDRIRPAFLKAADGIESEYERGRVLAALYPRSAPAER